MESGDVYLEGRSFGTATCVPESTGFSLNDLVCNEDGLLPADLLISILRDQDASLALLTRKLAQLEASLHRRIQEEVISKLRQLECLPAPSQTSYHQDIKMDMDWDLDKLSPQNESERNTRSPTDPAASSGSRLISEAQCSTSFSRPLGSNTVPVKQESTVGAQSPAKRWYTHALAKESGISESTGATHHSGPQREWSYKEIASENRCQPYKLSNSIWTASFFIGHRSIGLAAYLGLVLFFLCMNFVAQVTFVGVTASRLTEHTFSPAHILGLERWRQNVGHNVQYYDRVSDKSLVAKVCSLDNSLPVEISDNKAALVEAINSYLPTGDIVGVAFSGPALCIVAVLCWSLRVLAELHDIFEMFMSLRSIPWEGRSCVQPSADGSMVHFAAICTPRRVWIVFILLVRITICAALWIYGTLFLIHYSIEPADLVLNAVALEIVMNVDEGFFVLAPHTVKALFDKLAPLPRPPRITWKGLDCASLVLSVSMVAWLALHIHQFIIPQAVRVAAAKSTLCDGDLDFIYAVDPFFFVYSANTGSIRTNETVEVFRQAIMELMYPDTVMTRNLSSTLSGSFGTAVQAVGENVANLQLRPSLSAEESLAMLQLMNWEVSGCSDMFNSAVLITMQEVAKAFHLNNTPWDCEALSSLCTVSSQVVAVCPVTCGCNLPIAPLLLTSADFGCPNECFTDPLLWSTIETLPCVEKTPEELRADEYWPRWATQLHRQAVTSFGRYPEQIEFVCNAGNGDCALSMLKMGCGFIDRWNTALRYMTQYDDLDLCLGTIRPGEVLLKPLGPMCPITCGCLNATEEEAKAKRCPG
eukprot:CAMPEP_0206525828 /NCGR_PEP_ID=MMETSP0325_2-20121206/299_1 /ASSEMBLY_ACC=CAM_ASM_000347 /TAXON_ID=2866 /ORGANISM="Crypthecodinium cohnii, Strain Seligo" /LENGTH=815 /DNA_ID=CAMNT_0054020749 /DNA_START=45 /DNA_END=2489 /DNA_ORIENTATION=-